MLWFAGLHRGRKFEPHQPYGSIRNTEQRRIDQDNHELGGNGSCVVVLMYRCCDLPAFGVGDERRCLTMGLVLGVTRRFTACPRMSRRYVARNAYVAEVGSKGG